MKTTFINLIYFILIVSCQNSTSPENSFNRISFLTNENSYTKLDSINILIENNSAFNIVVALRCGKYLEMFYQKKENNVWSDNVPFRWMTLKCLSVLDTIKSNTVFKHTIKPETFETCGTYRLVLTLHKQSSDATITKFSNTFKIK